MRAAKHWYQGLVWALVAAPWLALVVTTFAWNNIDGGLRGTGAAPTAMTAAETAGEARGLVSPADPSRSPACAIPASAGIGTDRCGFGS